MKTLEDYALVIKAEKGDDSAFEELVIRYKNLVYSIILRMINDSEQANDLAQEVFIKVYKNLGRYQPEFKFSTWLIRITTNHIIDFRRKKKQEVVNIDSLTEEPRDDRSPEAALIQKEKTQLIQKTVNSLPEMYKLPLVLYHQQGLSYQEIADILEEPLSKVKNRIFRGRKLLKEALEGKLL